MTVSSAKTGAVGLSFALDNNYMEPIATTLVGSGGTNNITFNDIPQTYKHLQIRGLHKGNRATFPVSDAVIRFNSDSGNNYSTHSLLGNGSIVQAGGAANQNGIGFGQPGTSVTNFPVSIIDILDYTNTNKNKTTRSLNGSEFNSPIEGFYGSIQMHSGAWLNTNAIVSISLFTSDGSSWQQYSRFSLYGIKG